MKDHFVGVGGEIVDVDIPRHMEFSKGAAKQSAQETVQPGAMRRISSIAACPGPRAALAISIFTTF